ncbi:hypothetical protein HPB50_023873 [Hyalomma asiaticum]|uniref:Uncharacterized protein n=1 Tax=Hyalomma asiaticum TaxID=266040 RepID=A0ACB7T1L3_HYAAI|nr:hypothetical protein HPB50_023873 [Hyalomma asiaticum]
MLARLLKLKTAVTIDLTENDSVENLTNGEWRQVSAFVTVLQPVEEATTAACAESYPTLSLVVPLVHCMKLLLCDKTSDCDEYAFAQNLLKSINARFPAVSTAAPNCLATLLDPRFKDVCYGDEEKVEVRALVHSVLKEMSGSSADVEMPADCSANQSGQANREAAVDHLRTQLAAARVIQDWARTRLLPWLRHRRPRSTGGSLRVAPENSLDEDFGVVFPTIVESSEIAAGSMWPSGHGSSEVDLSRGLSATDALLDTVEAKQQVEQRNLDARKDRLGNADTESANRPDSGHSQTEAASLSDDTTYARLPSGPNSKVDTPRSLSPRSRSNIDVNDAVSTQQLFVQLPEPLPRKPVHQLLPGSSSEKIFGELLRDCKYRVPLTFDATLEDIGAEGCVKLCEGGVYTEVFRTCGKRGGAILKVYHPSYLVRHLPLLLTEAFICERKYRFRTYVHWVYAVWDKYPEVMVHACVNYHSRKNFSLFSDDERELSMPYVVLYMSYAGRPLNKVKFESALQIRSVVQQVALTLAVGETALEFEHRALTQTHVLVKEAHDQVVPFWLDGRALRVDMFGVQVSLVDFSAARMTPLDKETDTRPVYAHLNKFPASKKQALGETFADVYHVISEDLSQFHPWTNVEYLESLTKTLVQAYDGLFASVDDEAERRAWRDVCFWLAEMPHCGSARQFALELVAPSVPSTASASTVSCR